MPLTNSQYDEIIRDYQRQQLKNERERKIRCEEIYIQIPRIREIEQEIVTLSAQSARKRILGDTQALTELRQAVSNLSSEKEQLLRSHHYPLDYMQPQYRCKDCKDTGYIQSKPCHCFKQASINLLYRQSNIQEILKKENFSTLNMDYYSKDIYAKEDLSVYDYMSEVVQRCRSYAANFPNNGKSLYLVGKTGTGKTFLCNCIASAVIKQGHSVIYLTANHLFELFEQDTFGHDEESNVILDQYISECDLLIIDDLGSEFDNTFTSSRLFYCINQRFLLKKSTIISSNLKSTELRDRYSDRVASRIHGYYENIILVGRDIRSIKKLTNR